MSTTQYIGARYVPLFAEPAEWDSTRTYEPLTVVIHEGNSYTSKQAVPTGIAITNDKFWVLTANYNAQIETYRKDTAKAVTTSEAALATAQSAETKVDAEVTRAAEAEKVITDNLDAEVNRATDADKTLTDNLAAEVSRAEGAEKVLTDNLANEVSRATAADKTLTDNLAAEVTRATDAEKVLTDNLTSEVTRATTVEQTLTTNVNNATSNIVTLQNKFPITSSDISDSLKYELGLNYGSDFVVIGDSVSVGTGTSTPATDAWPVKFASANNLTLHNYAENNAGWKAAGSGANKANFVSQVDVARNDSSFSNDNVSIVIMMGGCNDSVQDPVVSGYVTNAVNTALNAFKNARIYVIPYFWGATPVNSKSGYNFSDFMLHFNNGINNIPLTNRLRVINYAWEWMAGYPGRMTDFIHPNTEGSYYLATVINNCIISNTDWHPYFRWTNKNICAMCANGLVQIEGNYIVSSDVSPYTAIITFPEWCKRSGFNMAVPCYNGSWTTVPIYYDVPSNTLACPNTITANTQLYIPSITWQVNL